MPDIGGLYPQPPQRNALTSDPMSALGALAPVIGAVRAMKELQTKQAIGNAYQKNLNPDGTPNLEGVAKTLREDPNASLGMEEAAKNIQDRYAQQTELQAKRIGVAATQNKIAMDVLSDLSNLDHEPTNEEIFNRSAIMARNNVDPNIITAFQHQMLHPPKGMSKREVARQYRNIAIGPERGSELVDVGVGPTGTMQMAPRYTTGKVQPAAAGEPAPGNSFAVAKELPPGTKASVDAWTEATQRASHFSEDMYPWEQALDAVKAIKAKYPGEDIFGPGTKARNEWRAYIQSFSGPLARLAGIDPEKLKEFQVADKNLTNALQTRANNFGANTDQKFATAIRGTPNVGMNDLAADELIQSAKAIRQAEQAQYNYAKQRGGRLNYLDSAAEWSNTHDVRAFLIDKVDAKTRNRILKSLSPEDRIKFNRTMAEANELGLHNEPPQKAVINAAQ